MRTAPDSRRLPLRWIARGGIALVSLLLTVGTVEGYLRIRHPGSVDVLNNAAFTRVSTLPGQMTELIPGARNQYFSGGVVQINEHGFRGGSFLLEKRAATYRVLAVGDSVTFGFGVPHEKTFHQQLPAALSGTGTEVINLGLPGAGLPYYLHTIRRWCGQLSPDLVLVSVVLNDISEYPADVLRDVPLARARGPADPAAGAGILRQSYAFTSGFQLLKSMLYAVGVLNLRDSPGYRFLALENASGEVERGWASSFAVLDATSQAAAGCGVPWVLVVFPLEVQLSQAALAMYGDRIGIPLAASATNLEPQRRLGAWATDNGVPFVDLTPAFRLDDPSEMYLRDLYVTLDPVHPSVRGHAAAAKLLSTELSRLGFVPPVAALPGPRPARR